MNNMPYTMLCLRHCRPDRVKHNAKYMDFVFGILEDNPNLDYEMEEEMLSVGNHLRRLKRLLKEKTQPEKS